MFSVYNLRDLDLFNAFVFVVCNFRAGLAVLNDKVYAVGGFNGSLRVKTVDLYDPSKFFFI